ncbi:MAG TPA: glycosyltransferase [Vicinamibacterales bacterium]|nr:glycosyltransferase [Vicinamibacterales bacterium]
MKRVLIVSPHFPPINAADMHRVRVSLPHLESLGWKPFVLAVDPACQEMPVEPRLAETLPPHTSVTYARALPARWTRRVGVGSVGLRAFAHLYRAGARLIAREQIDLVFFSTTVFPVMALGRLWKRRFGVPYVLDIQDAWLSDYYDDKPAARPPKYAWAKSLHGVLEPFTMRTVDGLMAVSAAYLTTLRRRYPWISEGMCHTLPFGASAADFDVADRMAWENLRFPRHDGALHGVAVGRGGDDMRVAAQILFRAIRQAAEAAPSAAPIRTCFIGTDYAPARAARKTIEPIARQEGLGALVREETSRVPYFEGLRLLREADFLVVLGSDDPDYSPSKVYPYILARRPIVAVLHAASPVGDLIKRTGAGIVVTFQDERDVPSAAADLARRLPGFLLTASREPDINWAAFEPYSAREMTRRQCEVFEASLHQRPAPIEVPCPG